MGHHATCIVVQRYGLLQTVSCAVRHAKITLVDHSKNMKRVKVTKCFRNFLKKLPNITLGMYLKPFLNFLNDFSRDLLENSEETYS